MVWKTLSEMFKDSPKKLYVAKRLFAYGLRIDERGHILLRDVKVPYASFAKAIGVDRRTVKETVMKLLQNDLTRAFFNNIEPAGPFLIKVLRLLKYRCLAIEVFEDKPGIIAMVATALAKRGVNIVQVLAEDPNLVEKPKLYIIVAGEVPGDAISEILKNSNIKSITVQ